MNDLPTPETNEKSQQAQIFEEAATETRSGIVAEFVDFLANNKKWWLTPIIVVLLIAAALIIAGSTAAAPFIYTLF